MFLGDANVVGRREMANIHCPYCGSDFEIPELGYCKLPEGKPPLLSDEDIVKATWINPNYPKDALAHRVATPSEVAIAQAQREADIKHYEEVKDD